VARALELLNELKLDEHERDELAAELRPDRESRAPLDPQVHAEVLAERAKMASLLEHLPVPVVIYEPPDFRIGLTNEAFRTLFGAEGVLGKPLREAYPGAHTVLAMLEEVCQTGEPRTRREYSVQRVGPDGRVHEHYFTSFGQPLFDGAGQVTGVLALGLDVTQEVVARTLLAKSARFSETFVGILGHDLRSPLSAITMAAALLERQASLEGTHLKRARQIASSASRMARMVDQLLDLTRARLSGGIPITRRTTDLVAVVSAALEELTSAHPGVTLRADLPRELLGEWDGDRLAQVVSNLLGNAIEHGDRTRPIRVALAGDDDAVTLSVDNDGPPIPEAVLHGLFDPLRGGRLAASPKSKGLGLGLYITREIVVAHGGSVAVRGDGPITFVVTLPRHASAT
jgi:signal transduction histidine kinase